MHIVHNHVNYLQMHDKLDCNVSLLFIMKIKNCSRCDKIITIFNNKQINKILFD